MAIEETKYVYLDNNATTQVAPEAIETIHEYLEKQFWNPSSMYEPALALARELGDARATVARLLGAQFADEIVFTSCATESNNAAINLYKKCGFVEINRRKKYYGDEDAIVMKKVISNERC